MKLTEIIRNKIDRMPKGYVFTYTDLIDDVKKKEAVIKSLNRMAVSGRIVKLSKGKYYKPETTVFGDLLPEQSQIVKNLLENDGKTIGYLTGYSIYNQLGLTTQISNTIQIGRNVVRPSFKLERFTISFIKQKNIITKENISLLQILDSMRYIKKIPDTTIAASCKRFIFLINNMTEKEKNTMIRLAMKYNPFTRALLGALMENSGNMDIAEKLKKSLNPITSYNLSGIQNTLETAKNWNIL